MPTTLPAIQENPHPLANAPALTAGESALIWVHSDLQLARPEHATAVLTAAVDDVLSLEERIDAVWCLGDALCGLDEAALQEVAQINIAQLERLQVPVCYVMGNHEFDLRASIRQDRFPLYDAVRNRGNWNTTASAEQPYFVRTVCGIPVVFFSEFAITGDISAHERPDYQQVVLQLREAIARHSGPVITVSHYAYPGGQRATAWMGLQLPLPPNVCLHLFGHAHIGDLVWNKENPWQREHCVHGHSFRQYNISALETARSAGSHSAFLEIGPNGPVSLRIRCHLERRWVDHFNLQTP